ncbi:hypothetical protein E4T56_gene19614 [Termitomyces sp. T112]|nr:hypothetical protein E4T56_gene19614 [Termitomyces sp. T112]
MSNSDVVRRASLALKVAKSPIANTNTSIEASSTTRHSSHLTHITPKANQGLYESESSPSRSAIQARVSDTKTTIFQLCQETRSRVLNSSQTLCRYYIIHI